MSQQTFLNLYYVLDTMSGSRDTMSNKTQNCLKELTDRFLRGSDTNYAKLQELFFIAPATLTFMYLSNKLFIIYVF